VEVNATFPGAFHHLSAAIVVSFSAYPLSAVLQYKFIILFTFIDLFHKVHSHHIYTFLSLPQFLASPVIFTNWGKQGVTEGSTLQSQIWNFMRIIWQTKLDILISLGKIPI
jgi:hypothetical protein